MKNEHHPIESLINRSPDLRKLVIESFKDQKGLKYSNSTVSLPQSVISLIEKINVKNDIPTKRIMQIIVKAFIFMERTSQELGDDYKEILKFMAEDWLENVYDPLDLVKKSYLMDGRDAKHLNLIAKSAGISRNQLISLGVVMLAKSYDQYEEIYRKQVDNYKGEFERILTEIQSIKTKAIEELDSKNDQIVLMAGRLENHVQMQLVHFSKYQENGIWYLGSSDSENIDFNDLISALFSDKK